MKRNSLLFIYLATSLSGLAQQKIREGWYRAELFRSDSIVIPFNFEAKLVNGKMNLFARNVTERIKIDQLSFKKDSVFIQMPVFESGFKAKIENDGTLRGQWRRATSSADMVLPFKATPGVKDRFAIHNKPVANISGRWAVNFISSDMNERAAVAEFTQDGNKLIGTFLTTTGDYRYLEGVVDGNSLLLSTFDGSHAYFFSAKIISPEQITHGHYYSGARGHQQWTARKDSTASIPEDASGVYLKEGEDRLNFAFRDVNGKKVSINDKRFKNKVVVVQIMGSWCPNCMDETKFLSDYYLKNRQRGIEMISLAYEYSDDFERSRKSLTKFKQRFNVQYPMLITGVKTSDSLRTEKTLPQLTPIKMFPTTIFIGKDGKVKKIHTGFTGPGTGEHFEEFKREFDYIIDALIKEKPVSTIDNRQSTIVSREP
jgi:thiol-disulfide isomerase/thioredoxin